MLQLCRCDSADDDYNDEYDDRIAVVAVNNGEFSKPHRHFWSKLQLHMYAVMLQVSASVHFLQLTS